MEGGELLERHQALADLTLKFFSDMGAQVSPDKCQVLATSAALRAQLKRSRFGVEGVVFPVRCDARDLGTHLNVGAKAVGVTGGQRL
eukprot:8228006-Alexandrium_andersonii.AAC.1